MIEIWKIINGLENYSISNFGNAINNKTNKRLTLKLMGDGYVRIGLMKDKKSVYFSAHRLVALHFIPNPENKKTVNHIDRNRSNNIVDNLEWATQREQTIHTHKNIVKKWSSGVRSVWRIDKNTNEKLQCYDSITMASQWVNENVYNNSKKTTAVIIVCISKVCLKQKGINKRNGVKIEYEINTAYGYKWEYIDVESLEGEIWKDLSCSKIHKISNYGRITNKNNRLAKPSKSANGYWVININGKPALLHRLVAMEFIPNPDNKPHVNHIDGNKYNYQIDNLEWVTVRENNIHAIETGLR
jgi:hypothetical protein